MNAQFYREVIADLRRRGRAMLAGADDLERLVGASSVGDAQVPAGLRGRMFRHADLPPATKRTWTKGRAKAGGSDDVILGVIRDGADTMKRITAEAKVKPYVAVCSVRRLIAAKKVTAEGATSTRRYRVRK